MKPSFAFFFSILFPFLLAKYSSQAQVIYTYAGSGQGYSGDGGPAVAAKFWSLLGVAADSAGNVYVSEAFNHTIRKINAAGIISTYAGNGSYGFSGDGGPCSAAKLDRPAGIATDAVGNLYIADQLNSRVRRINASGTISTVAGNGGLGFSGDGGAATAAALYAPVAVALDAVGNLYISDSYNNRIRKVTTAGTISTFAGTGVSGYAGDGGFATAAQLKSPGFITCDATGNLYISDGGNSRVRKVDAAGKISTIAGTGTDGFSGDGGPALLAQINKPTGLACDGSGNLYMGEVVNERVRRIDTAGVISTFAGTGTGGFGGDGGPANAALLGGPMGITLDAAGNLFIVDGATSHLRKVCINTCMTGIPSLTAGENATRFYPNPSRDSFQMYAGTGEGELSIYAITGQKVHSQELHPGENTIHTSGLSNGLYHCLLLHNRRLENLGKLVIE